MTAFVMILHSSTGSWGWTESFLPGFRQHFDNPLIVVDHNNNKQELEYLKRYDATIIPGTRSGTHGQGIDAGVQWCREHDIELMCHVEPDCRVYSRQWFENMLAGIEDHWMSGTFRHEYGPIHPCPSLWVVKQIRHSFCPTPKDSDVFHAKYQKLVNTKNLIGALYTDFQRRSDTECWEAMHKKPLDEAFYWVKNWDVGLKNWFECAINDKAHLAEGSGFSHFWMGSCREPKHAESHQHPWRIL